MNKIIKQFAAGVLTLATTLTLLPLSSAHAAEQQYYTDGAIQAGTIVQIDNSGNIVGSFSESWMTVEGETAYCTDINTVFTSGYKTRSDASAHMSADQISDVALSLEYVKLYRATHQNLSDTQGYLLEQCVLWRVLSNYLSWNAGNVRADYAEVSQAVQDEVYAGAKTFARDNRHRYRCFGNIYQGSGQDLGQFFAELIVGNAEVRKTSANSSITDENDCYSLTGATYGVYSDIECERELVTLTVSENGATETVEVLAGTVYVKELLAPRGYETDKTVYPLVVKAGKTATLTVGDMPKVTTTLLELFKVDRETDRAIPQGNASLEGAEFEWKYYDGYYTKDTLPERATRTWITKTLAEQAGDGTAHYTTRLADAYKVCGDSFYTQAGQGCLPLGTVTVQEITPPSGYLLEGAYLETPDGNKQIKGIYVMQITEDGELAVLSGSNQYAVSEQVIRGGMRIQKRDYETGNARAQGGATLEGTEFAITTLSENPVLVDGKLYHKGEVVKIIHTGVDGIAFTSANTLPYGNYCIDEVKAPTGYLRDGACTREFSITEDGVIVDLTDEEHSIANQILRGDIEGVKIAERTHTRLSRVPFKITSKTTGESHIVVTDENGQFSTASSWASHKHHTNEGRSAEDGVWFGTAEPNDAKGALLFDIYVIEELQAPSNAGFELIAPFEVVVSKDRVVIDLGTLTDKSGKHITIHTSATEKATGEKTVEAASEVTLVDTVSLEGLTIGATYQLKGWQMIREDSAELIVSGERVESEDTFTATDSSMEVAIEYTFDASMLAGRSLVTFEELYDLTDPDKPVKVAEHKDINDEGQTVTVRPTPDNPKTSTPETLEPSPLEKSHDSNGSLPKTGDTLHIWALVTVLLASSAGIIGVYLYRKRGKLKP